MTKVKICGITNLADAHLSLEAGADLLGFNFYCPSPRYVAPEVAADITATLRATFTLSFRCVGVFVNESLDMMRAIQQQCQLDLLQLHGDETPADVAALAPWAFKALRVRSVAEAKDWISPSPSTPLPQGDGRIAPRFLVDSTHPNLYGGTGTTGNWDAARDIAMRYPILLAGGLNPSNVADAIRAVRPWGVDVASGVERAMGLKDEAKVREFVAVVKRKT